MKYETKVIHTLVTCTVLIASANVGATHVTQPCGIGGVNAGNPTTAFVGAEVSLAAPTTSPLAWYIYKAGTPIQFVCDTQWALTHASPPTVTRVGTLQCGGNPQKIIFSTAGTYKIQATYADSASSCKDAIIPYDLTVSAAPPPTPTATLSASPTSIIPGASSTLTWSSTNATSCTGTGGWSQNLATSGSMSVTPTSTATYSISCKNSAGTTSTTKSVTISVNPVQTWLIPILNFMLD